MFPQRPLWNGSSVRLVDDGPLSSFQGRSSSASSFYASLLQAIDGVVFPALCPQVVSQAPQHFGSSEKQATCRLLCPWVCLLRHFPSLRYVQGSPPTMCLVYRTYRHLYRTGPLFLPSRPKDYGHWTILWNIHEGSHIGSQNRQRDRAQYFIKFILNELGHG